MGVNSLPKTATRQHRDCDLNPGPSAPESTRQSYCGHRFCDVTSPCLLPHFATVHTGQWPSFLPDTVMLTTASNALTSLRSGSTKQSLASPPYQARRACLLFICTLSMEQSACIAPKIYILTYHTHTCPLLVPVRQHLTYSGCLEVKGEIYCPNCCVLCCIRQLCTTVCIQI